MLNLVAILPTLDMMRHWTAEAQIPSVTMGHYKARILYTTGAISQPPPILPLNITAFLCVGSVVVSNRGHALTVIRG